MSGLHEPFTHARDPLRLLHEGLTPHFVYVPLVLPRPAMVLALQLAVPVALLALLLVGMRGSSSAGRL